MRRADAGLAATLLLACGTADAQTILNSVALQIARHAGQLREGRHRDVLGGFERFDHNGAVR